MVERRPTRENKEERPVRAALPYLFSADWLQAGVSQPIKAEIRPGRRIVGSIALCAVGCVTAGARHHDTRVNRISGIVTIVVGVVVRVVVAVIIGVVAIAQCAGCRQSGNKTRAGAEAAIMIPEATTAAESALTESALRKLRSAASGEIRSTCAADAWAANARLSAAESRTAADTHATTHASATDMHSTAASAHAASSAAVRMLGKGRGCNRQRERQGRCPEDTRSGHRIFSIMDMRANIGARGSFRRFLKVVMTSWASRISRRSPEGPRESDGPGQARKDDGSTGRRVQDDFASLIQIGRLDLFRKECAQHPAPVDILLLLSSTKSIAISSISLGEQRNHSLSPHHVARTQSRCRTQILF